MGAGLQSHVPPALWLEVATVLEHARRAGRHTASKHALCNIDTAVKRLGLLTAFYEPQPNEWGLRGASASLRRRLSGSHARLYYARSQSDLDEIVHAQSAHDNKVIGSLLGYPSCCVAANVLCDAMADDEYLRLAVLGTGDWRLNVYLSEVDDPRMPLALIPYFPCQPECIASVRIASQNLARLARLDGQLADILEKLLRKPLILRDPRSSPRKPEVGLRGAVLDGVSVGDSIYYGGHRSLHASDSLRDALLDQADILTDCVAVIRVHSTERGAITSIPKSEWRLVTFKNQLA